ncbi:unnamed protein product [Closterium sp. Naga37s-1]|nr:unnamed protein product [Closterium sp. Naga37s-1]
MPPPFPHPPFSRFFPAYLPRLPPRIHPGSEEAHRPIPLLHRPLTPLIPHLLPLPSLPSYQVSEPEDILAAKKLIFPPPFFTLPLPHPLPSLPPPTLPSHQVSEPEDILAAKKLIFPPPFFTLPLPHPLPSLPPPTLPSHQVSEPEDILAAKKLIFPGVGAFRAAMEVLNERGLADAIRQYVALDRPFLGICLGLQLLFDGSQEFGDVEGLGIIPGTVSRFDASKGLTVPQIGWNGLEIVQSEPSILDGVNGRHVYFVHSYRATQTPANSEWVLATANYGEPYVAAVRKGNVQAVQFHPEKSGVVGLDILRRFLGPNRSQQANDVEDACSKPLRGPRATQLAKRVIACLDVRANDRGDLVVTKGDQYDVREQGDEREVRNLGKPVELAARYFKEGADEVAFLNITGFRDFPLGDLPMLEVMKRASERVFVPLTVGGGIRDFTDGNGRPYSALQVAAEYFRSGADKVSIGSEAVFAAEELLATGEKTGKTGIEQISYVYGNQAVVVSIDPKRVYVTSPDDVPFKCVKASTPGPNGEEYAWYQCTVSGGREGRPIGAFELAQAVQQLGAGEILLNCIDCDGQGQGFDLDLVGLVSSAVSIPVIASSGAGIPEHFSQVFANTGASAALAAGIFHRNEVTIEAVKTHLAEEGVETRLL